jgi:hypothetical protein
MFVELLDGLKDMTPQSLYDTFLADNNADYYTWYMRLLTAGPHTYTHAYKYLSMYTFLYVCIYLSMYVYVYICICRMFANE